jgi:uncharacterized protein (TIGR03083 family)
MHQPPLLDTATARDAIGDDARALLGAAEVAPAAPVTACAPWDNATVVRHMGDIFGWMATVVTTGDRVSRRDLPGAPTDDAELPAWYRHQLDRVLEVFAAADPEATVWTFSATGERRVAWWHRRLAVETAVHRWDVQHATASVGQLPETGVAPVTGDVAAAGIEEFVVEFLPGLLSRDGVEGVTGTLHLHATDGPSEWWMDLDAGGVARPDHAKADTALRGTRSDLLLWLYNRVPVDRLDVFGPTGVLERWGQLAT